MSAPQLGWVITAELLATRRHIPPPAGADIRGVGSDPSRGGGTVGIIGGYLGLDGRLYWTHR